MREIAYRMAKTNKEDFMKKVEFETKLYTFLNPTYEVPSQEDLEVLWKLYCLPLYPKKQITIFAECNGEVVGCIEIDPFALMPNNEIDYSYGTLQHIFVDPNFRASNIALQLLRKGADVLIERGINKAIMNVQTHNKFRFLHYAICDEVLSSETYTRTDGSVSCTKTLAINDLKALQNKSLLDICREKRKHQKNFEEHGIELE